MYKVTSRWPHQASVKVEWNLGKRCNYNCSYCPSDIHDNKSPHTDIAILKRTADKLMTLGKDIRLSFTGGEPTVHPLFDELVNYCKHIGIDWISVTTNGTRPAAWLAKQRNNHYVFSLHFEKGWKRVLDTITKVYKTFEGDIMVNVMAQHDQMDNVREAVNVCLIHGIPFVVRRIRWTDSNNRDLFDDMKYKTEDLDWIKQNPGTVSANTVIDDDIKMHANEIIKLNLNQFENWICNAGIESLMINWDGEVYRATCRVDGSLGNIYKDTFSAPNEPVLCSRKFCTCAADIPLTKIKNENTEPNS